jgi:hypothetical protein
MQELTPGTEDGSGGHDQEMRLFFRPAALLYPEAVLFVDDSQLRSRVTGSSMPYVR